MNDCGHLRASKMAVGGGRSHPAWTHLTLLVLQSMAALTIIATIYRAFRIMIDDLGVKHAISLAELATIYCFSLELVRLGKSMQRPRGAP